MLIDIFNTTKKENLTDIQSSLSALFGSPVFQAVNVTERNQLKFLILYLDFKNIFFLFSSH